MKKSFLLVLVMLAGCGGESSGPTSETTTGFSDQTTLKEVYDVEYADGVAVIDDDAMAHLQSAVDGELTFSNDAASVQKLNPGQVVVFSRHALGRVVSVDKSGGGIIVRTTPAKFTEAFRNATIELETRVDWRNPGTIAHVPGFQLIRSAVADEDWSIGAKFDLNGVKMDVKFIPRSADRLEFEINATLSSIAMMKSISRDMARANSEMKSISTEDLMDLDSVPEYSREVSAPDNPNARTSSPSDTTAKVQAKGHISGFVQALSINVRDSNLDRFEFKLRELEGEARIEGAGLNNAAGAFDVKLPLEYVIPVSVGVVPISLKLGAAMKLTPQVHSGSAKFCFKADYSATTGLSFQTGSLKNESAVRRRKIELCGDEETVSAGPITVGFGATANFPEVSLLIFGNTIVPSAALNFGGTTLYEPGIKSAQKPCQWGNTEVVALVKVALSFFGIEMEREHKLWQRKKEWTCEGTIKETTYDPVSGEHTTTRDADDEPDDE